MPLLLYGARQAGKTYLLREFGEEYFENTVLINLEVNLAAASYFDDNISPERLIRYLEATVGEKFVPGKTLIIFDEIQSCERALTSLKYFCEQAPEYHIAAAGSLLRVAVNREKFSFPAGKVERMTLHPFDFEEYLIVGGMPAAMNAFNIKLYKKGEQQHFLAHLSIGLIWQESFLPAGGSTMPTNRSLSRPICQLLSFTWGM